MQALQSHDYLTPLRGKRLIKPKEYTDCVTCNIIDKLSTNHSKCFKTLQCTPEIYNYSFLGAQWLSGRVLDSRPRGGGFEPHWRHCTVVIEQDKFILA